MKAFRLRLNAYVMAETKVDALRRGDWFRAHCITRDMVPSQTEVLDVQESDIESNRALRRLVDRFTRPQHGPPASTEERDDLLQAIGIAYDGDATIAQAVVRELERSLGYLPRGVARTLIAQHTAPALAVVPEEPAA